VPVSDIRIDVSFRNHAKRLRLERLIGPRATGHLLDLWIMVAQLRPSGNLTGWDEIDVAIYANWDKDPHTLINSLMETKLLDRLPDGTYRIHDWVDHQGWVAGSEERSATNRMVAIIRHHGKGRKALQRAVEMGIKEEDFTDFLRTVCDTHTKGNAPLPLPSPLPSPPNNNRENKRQTKKYDPNCDAMQLSVYMLSQIREVKPDFKEPNLQAWADEADKMLRLDGRTISRTREIIRRTTRDSFWAKNILSMGKLREKYDQLELTFGEISDDGRFPTDTTSR